MLTNATPLSLFVTPKLTARTTWAHTVVRAKLDIKGMEERVAVRRHIDKCLARFSITQQAMREGVGPCICYF